MQDIALSSLKSDPNKGIKAEPIAAFTASSFTSMMTKFADGDPTTASTMAANASTTAADATFVADSSTADIVATSEPPAVKILTTMPADDDPAFIGQLIQHSSSKISKSSFPIDDLANIVNTVPKTVRPSTVLTSTVSMIADDNPIFNARAAIEPFLMKVALQWRCAMHADHGATTATIVWSPSKAPLNSTLSGNITNLSLIHI